MKKFDFRKALRTMFWVLMACAVGIASVADDIDWENFDFSLGVLFMLFYAAARVGVGWLKKSLPQEHRTGLFRLLGLLCVAGLVATSCTTLPGPYYANPNKSRIDLKIHERPTGEFLLRMKADGEVAAKQPVWYQGEQPGEGLEPWVLSLGDVTTTSPALMRAFDSQDHFVTELGKAVQSIPELFDLVGAPPGSQDPDGQKRWYERVLSLLMNKPSWFVDIMRLLKVGG